MEELYDGLVRVGAALSIIVGVGGLGALMGLDLNGHLILGTLVVVLIAGATQVQLLREIRDVVSDE